ncbi:hypothetical protein LCGC14_3002570, partial [marine sediment metagenome]
MLKYSWQEVIGSANNLRDKLDLYV